MTAVKFKEYSLWCVYHILTEFLRFISLTIPKYGVDYGGKLTEANVRFVSLQEKQWKLRDDFYQYQFR